MIKLQKEVSAFRWITGGGGKHIYGKDFQGSGGSCLLPVTNNDRTLDTSTPAVINQSSTGRHMY